MKRVYYVSEATESPSTLVEAITGWGYQVQFVGGQTDTNHRWLADWFSVILLEVDWQTAWFPDLLLRLKAADPGVPVIVMIRSQWTNLSMITVARQDGAEAVFFDPHSDLLRLQHAIQEAFSRLARWKVLAVEQQKRSPAWPLAGAPQGHG